jgi:cytochrome c oxidase assembly protein subunit 15
VTPPDLRGASLALGFGTAVAMWEIGYLGRLPFVQAPAALLFALFVLCLLAGGFVAGRLHPGGLAMGAKVGALAAGIDLLVLGSLLGDMIKSGALSPAGAAGGAVLFVAVGTAMGALGGVVGGRLRGEAVPDVPWAAVMGLVAVAAIFLLLMVGGLVTSNEAGLAVVDWPGTEGWLMFLYPLSQMTGGVYYEHAHRLFGALVGLTTFALAILVWRIEPERRWLRNLAAAAVFMVCLQGLLGGLRVTGHFTLSADPNDTRPSLVLALVHGALAQIFFSVVGIVAAALTPWWREASERQPSEHGEADRGLTAWFLGLVALQLILGALVRHFHVAVTWHITVAVLVLVIGIASGARCWGLYSEQPVLPKVGLALMIMLGLQLLLGVGAYATSEFGDPTSALSVPLTTAHQTMGAAILAMAFQAFAWHRLLIEPTDVVVGGSAPHV